MQLFIFYIPVYKNKIIKTKYFFPILYIMFFCTPAFSQQDEKIIILDSIVIYDLPITETPHMIINTINKAELHTSNSRDVGEYLRSIPNISGIRKGGSAIDPVVRGFKFSQLTVILNNGDKMENGCPNRMDPVSSHMEVEDIEKIQVIKGPFSLQYGPAFGGVINLVPQNPVPYEKFEIHTNAIYGYESNWNGRKLHGTIQGGNEKIFFLASGGYRNYGNYKSGGWQGRDTTYNASFKKYNYSFKLGIAPKANHEIIMSFSGIHGRDVMYPALPMDEISDNTHTFNIDYSSKKLSPFVRSLDMKLYRSTVHHIMDNSYRSNYNIMQMIADVDAINTGGKIKLGMLYGKHKIQAGVDFENIDKDGKRTGTMTMMETTSSKITNLWNKALIRNTGLFAEYSTYFDAYELSASIRGDLNTATSKDTLKIVQNGIDYFKDPDSQFINLSASVGITRMFTRWFNISLALGRGIRSPNMLERFIKLLPVGYDQYDYLGNPRLEPEINNEADLTFTIDNNKFGKLYLNFFYSYVSNYITARLLPSSVIKPQSQGVLGVKQFVNTEYVIHRGFELGYKTPERHKLGCDFMAALTYGVIPSVTKYIISGSEIVDDIQIKNDALPEIPPLESTINIYYKFGNGYFTPKLTIRAVAAQNHVSEAFYEEKTPGFWIAGFSANYKINSFLKVNGGISNIFNLAYYEHLNRRIIGSRDNLYEPGRVIYATVNINL